MKVCSQCKEAKPDDSFIARKDSKDGLRGTCRACHAARCRQWSKANPEAQRAANRRSNEKRRAYIENHRLQRKYGISLEQKEALIASQGGVCAICGTTETPSWQVDHCHDTNVVGGVLCVRCNLGLGYFKDSAPRLRAATQYLEGGAA